MYKILSAQLYVLYVQHNLLFLCLWSTFCAVAFSPFKKCVFNNNVWQWNEEEKFILGIEVTTKKTESSSSFDVVARAIHLLEATILVFSDKITAIVCNQFALFFVRILTADTRGCAPHSILVSLLCRFYLSFSDTHFHCSAPHRSSQISRSLAILIRFIDFFCGCVWYICLLFSNFSRRVRFRFFRRTPIREEQFPLWMISTIWIRKFITKNFSIFL